MAGLEISPAKVGFVIVKSREIAAKVAAWDDGATSDHDAEYEGDGDAEKPDGEGYPRPIDDPR